MSTSLARDGARGGRSRLSAALLIGGVLALALAGPVGAAHTEGTLDCGAAGVYETDAGSALPPGFEAPGPWSGLFLLHGTTTVFKAFAIVTPAWTIERTPATAYPKALVTCTLSSSGPNFQSDWTLVGFLTR